MTEEKKPEDTEKYRTGYWYDQQYATEGSHYHRIYGKETPPWAESSNTFHAGLVAAWLCLQPGSGVKGDSILDLGSGVGRYLNTWERLGYRTQGVEISKEAIKLSGRSMGKGDGAIYCASASDLSFIKDQSFTVAFSTSFLEHIAAEDTAAVLRESMRVAKYGAHFIDMVEGDDPSHIHVQSEGEWVDEMLVALGPGYGVHCIQVGTVIPLFLTHRLDAHELPWPISQLDGGYQLATPNPKD